MTQFSCLFKENKAKRQQNTGKIATATKIAEHKIVIQELVWRVNQCLQKVKGFVDCWKNK
jgi:hypothetical protein